MASSSTTITTSTVTKNIYHLSSSKYTTNEGEEIYSNRFGTSKWSDANVNAQYKEVESSIAPLIDKLTTIGTDDSTRLLSRRKRTNIVESLVDSLSAAIARFVDESMRVLADHTSSHSSSSMAGVEKQIHSKVSDAIGNMMSCGNQLVDAAREFVHEASSTRKRSTMVEKARELLSAVARMMTLADMMDYEEFVGLIAHLKNQLASIGHAASSGKVNAFHSTFKSFANDLENLLNLSSRRLKEIRDPLVRDEYARVRGSLKMQTVLLFNASKTLVQSSTCQKAKSLQDELIAELSSSLDRLLELTNNRFKTSSEITGLKNELYSKASNLLETLNQLDKEISEMNSNMNPATSMLVKEKIRNELSTLEKTVSVLTSTAKSLSLSDESAKRNDRLLNECNSLSKALNNLMSVCEANRPDQSLIEASKNELSKSTKRLRRGIQKSVVDTFSNSYHEANMPLDALVNCALNSRATAAEFERCVRRFDEHARKLIELSAIACSLSNNADGVHLVQTTSEQLRSLTPMVINAARILFSLASKPEATKSAAINSMNVFRNAWLNSLRLLVFSVDEITSIHDFLAVSEQHILEDIYASIDQIHDGNAVKFSEIVSNIRGRTLRICEVVSCEMDNFEPCEYTQSIQSLVDTLKKRVLVGFTNASDCSSGALNAYVEPEMRYENEFIDASRSLYDHVCDLRNAILLMPHDAEYDESDDEISHMSESNGHPNGNMNASIASNEASNDESTSLLSEMTASNLSTTALDKNITEEQREQIKEQLDSFQKEKHMFDKEVLKWDDKSNDIIVLAKQMSIMLMDMIDFTRGKGPIKSPSEIVTYAKKLSECGSKMERLVKELANECPASITKDELMNYLKSIPLFCNQLSIAGKAKQVVMDLDSVTSLIIASKNLMNSVISVVKSSYIASTKYTSKTASGRPLVQWKMKPPEKKPIIFTHRQQQQEVASASSLIRKGSIRKRIEPVKVLAEFQV